MSEVGFPGQVPGSGTNVIRVAVPVKTYYDLDALQKVQRGVLGRLGCEACCSGWDIRFDVARQFVVDEKLNVRPVGIVEP